MKSHFGLLLCFAPSACKKRADSFMANRDRTFKYCWERCWFGTHRRGGSGGATYDVPRSVNVLFSCPTFCTTLVTTPISALPHKRPRWVVSQPSPPAPPPLQLWKYLPPTNRPYHSSGLSTHQHLHLFSVGSISNTCIEIRGGRVESFTSHHPFTSH